VTPAVDEHAVRRARVRAVATAIVDRQSSPRHFRVDDGVALRGSERRRRQAAAEITAPVETGRPLRGRRLIAVAVLALQIGALVAALWLPAFRVRSVDVSGLRLLDRGAVLRTASVPNASIFTVDADSVATRVRALPWVRSVTVTTDLPNTVHIAVTEWQPMVRVRRDGHDIFYAENGAGLDLSNARAGAASGIPLLIDDRPAAMRVPVPASLIQVLGGAARNFPSIFGTPVVAYQWEADGRFSVWAGSGWRAILGHVETDAAIAAVAGQLAALSTLRSALNFAHPDFGYVDLENSSAPAVGGTPGLTDEIRAALLAGSPAAPAAPAPAPPAAAAMPAPTPTPKPTPKPTPTPPSLVIP
jgi:hypothetical protein